MKKTFILAHPKKAKDRLFEEAIAEVKKYMKREQKKSLPDDFDYWDFDCKFGNTKEEAKTIAKSSISKYILDARKEGVDSFYLEILAKPCVLEKKISIEPETTEESTPPKPSII